LIEVKFFGHIRKYAQAETNAMNSTNNNYSYLPDDTYLPSARPTIGVTDIIATLRRHWAFLVFGSLTGLALGISYIASVPTLYKSSARIMIDTSVDRYLQANKIIDAPGLDDAQIGSQIYILSSESVADAVINSMDLVHDPEFAGPVKVNDASPLAQVKKLVKVVHQAFGLNDDRPATIDPDVILGQTTVEAFFKHLNVYREDVANVINISFESEDPNKAAKITNAIADTYIAMTSEAKLGSKKIISQYIQTRLAELKSQAEGADQALRDYKRAHKDLPSLEQLAALDTQLTNAKIAVAEAKARLDGIQQRDVGKVSPAAPGGIVNAAKTGGTKFALNNAEIAKLRSDYRDLAGKTAELESSLGPKHAAVIKLHKQMDDLRASIREQEQLIADSYANEYQMAKARETELAATVARLGGDSLTGGQEQTTLRQLESSADTLRNLYNGFLQFSANTMQIESIPAQSARIISKAVPPLQKDNKKRTVVFLGSILAGLCLGAAAAVGKEMAADVFRTSKAVEQGTGIYCATLPMVKVDKDRTASSQGSKKSSNLDEYVLDAPYSRFTEALRNLKAVIAATQLTHGVKVIGVVSSVPGEGKTAVMTNLAALMVASSGARTLVIDCDVHLRRLTARLAPTAEHGLIEALVDPSRIDRLVSKRERSGMDVLPCNLPGRVPNAADLLGNPRMEQLFIAARKTYDYIFVEIAPIMSVADVKLISRFIDRFVFVVEWGQTKRRVVLEALSEARLSGESIIGIVLNKADPDTLATLEAYKGRRFLDYYQG
jgi:polysaccharide biosynthesis transport protein